MLRSTVTSTGTVAANFGGSFDTYIEDASGNPAQQASSIATIWTTPTHGAETSAIILSGVTAGGALTEWGRIDGTNGIQARNGKVLKAYNSDNTKNVSMYHDGDNTFITSSSGGLIFGAPNNDGIIFTFGGDSCFRVQGNLTTQQLVWVMRGGSEFGRQIVFGDFDSVNSDFDHNETTNPTIFLHSVLNPNTSNNQWGSFSHDQENFVITTGVNVGTGTSPTTDDNAIVFSPRGTEAGRFDSDATAGNTRFMLYDVDNGTMERVSVGAPDSGGVGYKVLRIAN
jgi:hypothetical protein